MKGLFFIAAVALPSVSFATKYSAGYINPQMDKPLRCSNSVCAGDDRAQTYEKKCKVHKEQSANFPQKMPVLFASMGGKRCVCYCDYGSIDNARYNF